MGNAWRPAESHSSDKLVVALDRPARDELAARAGRDGWCGFAAPNSVGLALLGVGVAKLTLNWMCSNEAAVRVLKIKIKD